MRIRRVSMLDHPPLFPAFRPPRVFAGLNRTVLSKNVNSFSALRWAVASPRSRARRIAVAACPRSWAKAAATSWGTSLTVATQSFKSSYDTWSHQA
eukprot:2523152-Pyramimonas_sp.AAC.1